MPSEVLAAPRSRRALAGHDERGVGRALATAFITGADESLGDETARRLVDVFVDVLVENAGVPGSSAPADDLTAADALAVHDVDVDGIVRMTHAFLPLLRKGPNPVVVDVASGLGSFTTTHDPEHIESRGRGTPLHVLEVSGDHAHGAVLEALPNVTSDAVDPGSTATDVNDHGGPQPVTEGTGAIVELATIGADGPTGVFRDRHGVVGR